MFLKSSIVCCFLKPFSAIRSLIFFCNKLFSKTCFCFSSITIASFNSLSVNKPLGISTEPTGLKSAPLNLAASADNPANNPPVAKIPAFVAAAGLIAEDNNSVVWFNNPCSGFGRSPFCVR